jgi:biotin carboxylase
VPRVLILSTTTGYQLRSFGEAAQALGFELMFATDRCHTLDDPWRDAAVAVRFHEEDESLAAIRVAAAARPIDGVIAVGDRPVVLAARTAEALGLPGNPAEAARASANKRLAHERLARAGLPVAAYVHTTVDADIRRLAAGLSYPAVIKPVGLSGSRGVIRADDGPALVEAFHRVSALLARPEIRAQRTGLDRDLLIEQFIPGREYAIEGLLTEGVFTPLALFDKPDPLDGPFFEETIYVTPSSAPPALQAGILDAVQRAAQALGLRHGPVHAECRALPAPVASASRQAAAGEAHQIYVLEVAARPIGGLCSRVLRFERGGAVESLEHVLLQHAVGRDLSTGGREPNAAAVMMIPIPRRGVLKRVSGEDDARQVPYVEDVRITAKIDQVLEPLPEAGSYLGFIFARAARAMDAECAVRDAHRRLVFHIDTALDVRAG